jgi:hypothetical protein
VTAEGNVVFGPPGTSKTSGDRLAIRAFQGEHRSITTEE